MKFKIIFLIFGILFLFPLINSFEIFDHAGTGKIGNPCQDTTDCSPTYLTEYGFFYGYCNQNEKECRPVDGMNGNYNQNQWCKNIIYGSQSFSCYLSKDVVEWGPGYPPEQMITVENCEEYYRKGVILNSYSPAGSEWAFLDLLGWEVDAGIMVCDELFPNPEQLELIAENKEIPMTNENADMFRAEYDYWNNKIVTIDEDGTPIEINYYDINGNGRLYWSYSPISGNTFVSKDPAGNILQAINANGNKVKNYYDDLDRIIKSEYFKVGDKLNFEIDYFYDFYFPGGESCAKDWEGNYISSLNLLCEVRDNSGYTKFLYDEKGRIIEQKKVIYETEIPISQREYVLKFEYDSANNLKILTLPDGKKINYFYNDIGQLREIFYEQEQIANFEYTSFGGVAKKILNPMGINKINVGFVYTPKNLLESLFYDGENSNLKFARTMQYDFVGNVKKIYHQLNPSTEDLANEEYDYDSYYRLKKATYDVTKTINYKYKNAWGDRETMIVNGISGLSSSTYEYDEFQLDAVDLGEDNEINYRYDFLGNVISTTNDGTTSSLFYDSLNRMDKVISGGNLIEYTYDYTNNRVKKKTPTEITFYLYQGNNVLYEETIPVGQTDCLISCGDFTSDGVLDMNDFNYLLNYFYGVYPQVNLCAGDLDNNGVIDELDLIYFADYLFGSGPAPSECDINAEVSSTIHGTSTTFRDYVRLMLMK